MISKPSLQDDYWEKFQIHSDDIDFLYSLLLENETPQTSKQLITAIVQNRIQSILRLHDKEKQNAGSEYLPKDEFDIGQSLVFPALDWISGKVETIRDGFNPEFEPFKVIEVSCLDGQRRYFASHLNAHALNSMPIGHENNPDLNSNAVIEKYGDQLIVQLEADLNNNKELVRIAGSWFPKSLLVDIHNGHLNLAEAVMEEASGEPLSTRQLLGQIELKSDSNLSLTEFSLNYALQEDNRFDEVGPSGEVLWCLKDLEPEDVRKTPIYLQFEKKPIDNEPLKGYLEQFEGGYFDELEDWEDLSKISQIITLSLIYPHWRAGTLPLSHSLARLFPTAFEAPRVRFIFVDKESDKRFPGWVVRPSKYVSGLSEWYKENGLIPGSLIKLRKGEHNGEIVIECEKCRQSREWMRTALIGSDQGVVFGMLKQNVATTFNERMAMAIPDPLGFDELWKKSANTNEDLNKQILKIMRELSKLNPQVHAQELYAAVNVVRRCPPSHILNFLVNNPAINHLGDLYFRINENVGV